MENGRRKFIKTAAFAAAGTSLLLNANSNVFGNIKTNKISGKSKMKLTFKPVNLELKYKFTVATYSRTMTPNVQVKIEYEKNTGYGEAAMPQYLGESEESVCAFLQRVNLEQFRIPFEMETYLHISMELQKIIPQQKLL